MNTLKSYMVPVTLVGTGTTSKLVDNVSAAYSPSVEMVILGHLPSMKNNRRILKKRSTGKPFSGKSSEAIKYVEDFCLQVPSEYRSFAQKWPATPLRANVSVYYRSERSDLDTALVYDCLQLAGVIGNDRQIYEHHEWKHVDKDNPRVEIRLEEI